MNTTAILILLLLPIKPEVPAEANATSWQSLKQVCRLLDLWDADERWGSNFNTELQWAWDAYRQLQGAPPSGDIARWPDQQYASSCMMLSNEYKDWLEAKQAGYSCYYLETYNLLVETRQRCEIWNAVYALGYDTTSLYGKRLGLKRLKELLGDEAYWAGTLPAWRP